MDIRTISSRGYDLWTSTIVSGTEVDATSIYTIWDGSAVMDIWSDWVNVGVGVETAIAAYESGNGLLIEGVEDNSSILMHSINQIEVNINNYNFLSFWLNVRNWMSGKDITFSLYSNVIKSSTYLSLSDYVNFDKLRQWQHIMIPLERLSIRPSYDLDGVPTYINEIEFILQSGIDFWMDNIALIVGEQYDLSIGPPVVDNIIFEGDLIPIMSQFINM